MWIPSKLTRPARLHNAILRPRLLETLEQAPFYRLVLFRSPAGYGKTTMAAQWLNEHPHTGWFNIDENDNDTFRFVNYLLQNINKATNNACLKTQAMAERRQFACLSTLFSELFGELAEYHEQTYIVLDDYHLINNDDIHDGLRFFLKHMPDNLTLVVTSRTLPPLGTANLRIRDLLIEVDNDLLAFDEEETTRFFDKRIGENIEANVLKSLHQQVEGWPSALQLIALHAQQKPHNLVESAESMASFNRGHLWDYLAEEVFDLLDDETQQFLLQCSVLDMFNAQLVTDLTGRSDALAVLESLNRFGLFLNTLEGDNNWYRFHNLFAEFLRHQRYSQIPQQRAELHALAAKAWLKQNSPQQALLHAQKCEDSALVIHILCDFGWEMFHHGEMKLLQDALGNIDTEELYAQPRLNLLHMWLLQSQHLYNDVGDMIQETEKEFAKRDIELDDALQGEFNALRAQVAINQSKPDDALILSEQALGQLPSTTYRSRIVATSVVGEVHHCLGNLSRALPMMQQTEKMARQYHVYHQALWALLQQAEILLAQGYVQNAYELLEQAFKLVKEQHLQQVPLHEFLLRLRAQILWCWNRLDEAEEAALRSLEVLAPYDETKSLHAYSMLARIAITRGEQDKASRYLDLCNSLMSRSVYHIDWRANTDLANLLFWQNTGDIDSIQQWLVHAEQPEAACNHFQQLQWRNIGRACVNTGEFERAEIIFSMLDDSCNKHNLITDKNRNLVVQAVLSKRQENRELALTQIKQALELTNSTGMVGIFLCDGSEICDLIQELVDTKALNELELHRARQLLREMTSKERNRSVHFDENFVEKLLNLPNVPELIRTSPLTQREWQVLGLIYTGYSNEQIASELDVASTTIKTHIRNLYQKLNIANRQQAIETAENLLKLMGF
ncbi:HTH-type transcriptional regulator MalT [Photobacterium sp. ZSDE20]|uniref:HTH-type transcriptional regulator MalT n=1 Tax=Photobacterium pectinilyticum TaxID=2906793 RepID=A0ABT1N2Z2_9GAMM|nr:HTH-type transcriptional regulator MalT [Photobacterium sp. ZSDE20]MCQ1059113.1 HTH-type transcriptional regulator MalT [Photobacterium sp. ZSDE20]MDD1824344.1 HTH-type transcriptional regulator MalT [Photobacterium sp. ZSDE20]